MADFPAPDRCGHLPRLYIGRSRAFGFERHLSLFLPLLLCALSTFSNRLVGVSHHDGDHFGASWRRSRHSYSFSNRGNDTVRGTALRSPAKRYVVDRAHGRRRVKFASPKALVQPQTVQSLSRLFWTFTIALEYNHRSSHSAISGYWPIRQHNY